MRNLIIETDLGRDADDFMAICYLAAAGVKIRAMYITPGDPDQIAIAKFLNEYLNLDTKIYASKLNRNKQSSGGVHYQILGRHKYPINVSPDTKGSIADIMAEYPDTEFFIIGPPTAVGKYFIDNSDAKCNRLVMQGGFIGYDVHGLPCERLEKFEGKETVPSFNPGGAKKGTLAILNANIEERRFVSKNLCHTIVYDKQIHQKILSMKNDNVYINLLCEAMDLYLQSHDEKMFHDPTAAVAYLHPEIVQWVNAKLYYEEGKWGSKLELCEDFAAVDINREELWQYIAMGE